jgi:hypothetical protein
MLVHACNPSTWEAEAGVQVQPGLHSETYLKNKKQKTKKHILVILKGRKCHRSSILQCLSLSLICFHPKMEVYKKVLKNMDLTRCGGTHL